MIVNQVIEFHEDGTRVHQNFILYNTVHKQYQHIGLTSNGKATRQTSFDRTHSVDSVVVEFKNNKMPHFFRTERDVR
jgi:hypothetical protein